MEFEDLKAFLNLFDRNVENVQQNLTDYKRDVDTVRRLLLESCPHVARADGRIISVHNGLLSSVSEVNENIIKLNLQINLNKAKRNLKNVSTTNQECLQINNDTENHTNLHGIEVGELDIQPVRGQDRPHTVNKLPLIEIKPALASEEPKPESGNEFSEQETESKSPSPFNKNELSLINIKPSLEIEEPKSEKTIRSAGKAAVPEQPIQPRKSDLLPPKRGKKMTDNEVYDTVFKNISHFSNESIVEAVVMYVNLLDNYFVVAKWESMRLKQLLALNLPVEELHQLPDFGEVFGIYDDQEEIITRALIYNYSENNGYYAYLLDYGEHMHMNGDEVIFKLPKDVADLPAEAIRCYISNKDMEFMSQFLFKDVRLRILDNNGYDLDVELVEDEIDSDFKLKTPREEGTAKDVNDNKLASSPKKRSQSNAEKFKKQEQEYKDKLICSPKLIQYNAAVPKDQKQPPEIDHESIKSTTKLSSTDMAMLEDVGQCTSDAVKAVLGFNPKDDQRICRHYDPKYGGCFKGSNCRKLHQPFAPHGATKDTELTETLPEIRFESFATRELGSTVRVLVTYICSPTKVYVHFVGDESPPLVWSKDDVPESERIFKRDPLPLDMVLALYNDGYYYRAQIIENNDGMFTIFYVDYGNTELVTIKSLAVCNNARSLKPHRAVCCFLHGIQLGSISSSKAIECVEYLKSRLLNVEFNVKLIYRMPDDGYVIKFVDHHAEILDQMMDNGGYSAL